MAKKLSRIGKKRDKRESRQNTRVEESREISESHLPFLKSSSTITTTKHDCEVKRAIRTKPSPRSLRKLVSCKEMMKSVEEEYHTKLQ